MLNKTAVGKFVPVTGGTIQTVVVYCRSQWPRGLRLRSSAARLLRLCVRISPGACMFVCCECCVLSGRGLYDVLITRPEESYWLWRVVVRDQETSKTRRLKSAIGLWKIQPQWVVTPGKETTTTSLVRSPTWKGATSSGSKEIPSILKNKRFRYRVSTQSRHIAVGSVLILFSMCSLSLTNLHLRLFSLQYVLHAQFTLTPLIFWRE
jgi:hypothetical protein